MGGSNIRVGDFFNIYSPGKDMIDPYTGESLGTEETLAGKVKIQRVESKFSIGYLISGAGIEQGMIARVQNKRKPREQKYRPAQRPVEENVSGYKLPFD